MELLDRAPLRRPDGGAPPPLPSRGRSSRSLQQRLEESGAGQWAITTFLVATLAAVVVWNLPESEMRRAALPVVEPYVRATGLDQVWDLFAPNPPRSTFEVLARIEYADGSQALWQPPRNDRWRKWLGAVRLAHNRALWEPTAAWIAGNHDDGGRRAVRVELIQRHRELLPPGAGNLQMAWQEAVFFTHHVPPGDGR